MNAAAARQTSPGRRILLPPPSRTGDAAFKFLTWSMAMMVFVLVVILGVELCCGARQSLQLFGGRFLIRSDWNPVSNDFGALPCIAGTFVSSLLGLAIALPLSLATAIYLTELAPAWVRQPAISLIEMLAAIPSVILGFWGIFVLVPWLRDGPFPLLKKFFGFLPFFQGPMAAASAFCPPPSLSPS